MMLRVFVGISLVVVSLSGMDWYRVTPLNAVQSRILGLLGFPPVIYQGLGTQSGEPAFRMSER